MLSLHTSLVALVAGFASAGLYVVGLGGSIWGVFLVLVSPLPIYIAGMKWGSLAAGAGGVFAVMGSIVFSDLLIATVFSFAFVMPAFLLVHLATTRIAGDDDNPVYLDATDLTLALVVIGILMVIVTVMAISLTQAGLVGTIRSNLSLLTEALYGARSNHGPDMVTDVADIIDFWDSPVLGFIIAAVLSAHVAMGALGQGLVNSSSTPIRTAPPFWRLSLPTWPTLVALILVVVILGLDTMSYDREGTPALLIFTLTGFFLVFCVGFLLQGLAVLHALTRGMGWQPLILVGAYMTVLILQPFGAMAFAAVGFVDHWANFRGRFGVADDAAMED
ncbi:MAG: hypothetical protein GDA49_07965 [Rhodospirillales bacterium]|nr:hypothetical protein [Rhodospirillales bacterium]